MRPGWQNAVSGRTQVWYSRHAAARRSKPVTSPKVFKSLLKDAGLPRVRLHDLRHTAALLLLTQGVSPRVVMETLGHSQISLTMNTYTHVVPELQRDAADRMDSALRGGRR